MKWAGLALLLLNLLFFAWSMRPAATSINPPSTEATDASRLVLLRELNPAQKPPARSALVPAELPAGVGPHGETDEGPAEKEKPTAELAAKSDCYRASGFVDEKSAAKSKARLEKAGLKVKGPTAEKFERTRFWVLLPPTRSKAQALSVVKRVKRAGVKDYYLIPNGKNRNALSLGVFSSREAAQRRVAEVAGLKFKVRVEEVKYPARRYVLEWRRRSSKALPLNRILPADIEVTSMKCGAAS